MATREFDKVLVLGAGNHGAHVPSRPGSTRTAPLELKV